MIAGTPINPVARYEMTLISLGIPYDSMTYDSTVPIITVTYSPNATAGQIAQGNQILSTWDYRDYRVRTLNEIYQDLQALTTAQHGNAWTDISAPYGGAPRKYLTDTGLNAAPLFVMDWIIFVSRPTGAQLTAGQQNILAQYVQDNLMYLVNPAFDSTINVPGAVPV
jgi:hypothetical protein